MTEIAIVILNWNTQKQLEAFLPSIISHSLDESVEVIVADNGSTDGSVEFLQNNYPDLRTIVFDKNYGFTGGYNRALAELEARYYLILNSDIKVTVNWLTPLKECMDNDDNIAACMPKMKSYRHREFFEYAGAAGGFIDQYGYPFCRGRILDTVEKDEGQYNDASEIFWATGACMFIRASLFHRLGGFDDDFFAHMEEIDLCWRLKNRGYQIRYVPQSVVYHVGGGTLANDSPFKLFLNYRNNLFLLYKNLPQNDLFFILGIRFLMDWMSSVLFLIQGKRKSFTAVFRAHWQFVLSVKDLKEKRRNNPPGLKSYPGQVFPGSIVFQYFFGGKKQFFKLKFRDYEHTHPR